MFRITIICSLIVSESVGTEGAGIAKLVLNSIVDRAIREISAYMLQNREGILKLPDNKVTEHLPFKKTHVVTGDTYIGDFSTLKRVGDTILSMSKTHLTVMITCTVKKLKIHFGTFSGNFGGVKIGDEVYLTVKNNRMFFEVTFSIVDGDLKVFVNFFLFQFRGISIERKVRGVPRSVFNNTILSILTNLLRRRLRKKIEYRVKTRIENRLRKYGFL